MEDVPAVEVPYDTLIVAAGSKYSYFGHPEWADFAPEVKSLERALDVRRRILAAFEAAELETDPEQRAEWLTFAVVGAGPTGVEMAGQIAELARDTLPRDFRSIDTMTGPDPARRGGRRVLAAFPPDLSESAERQLEHLGVTSMVDSMVVGIDEAGVELEAPGGSAAPGRRAHGDLGGGRRGGEPRGATCEGRRGRGRPRGPHHGRARPHAARAPRGARARRHGARARADGEVQDLPGRRAGGDAAGPLRRRALVARRVAGRQVKPFRYIDKGNLATIGRARAVAEIKRVHFGGPLAWLLWLGIHIFYLIGFQNRLLVLLRWGFSFLTRGRGARLITGEGVPGSRCGFHTPRVELAPVRGPRAAMIDLHDDHPATLTRRTPRALPLPRRVPPVLDVALRVRRRSLHGDGPRRVDRRTCSRASASTSSARCSRR